MQMFGLMVSGRSFEDDGVDQQVDKHHTTLNEELLETWWELLKSWSWWEQCVFVEQS